MKCDAQMYPYYIYTENVLMGGQSDIAGESQGNSRWDHFGEWYYYIIVIKLFVDFLCEFRKGWNMSETEMET